MSFCRASLAVLLSTALLTPLAMASRVHRAPTSGQTTAHKSTSTTQSKAQATTHKASSKTTSKSSSKKYRRIPKKIRGQQVIDSDRVTQIQQALIREHYLNGEASGSWDSTTQTAMQKYQADQGWQSKLMPDSRALKKLGLGPDYSNAINAQTSNFGAPAPASTIPPEQAAGFATGARVSQQ